MIDSTNFQNLPSKKLYEFLQQKVDRRELTRQQIVDALEVYQKNPGNFFHSLKTGHMSIKIEHILKAQEAFGLNPCDLFHEDDQTATTETKTTYGNLDKLIDVIHEQQKLVSQQQQTINNLLSGGQELRRKQA